MTDKNETMLALVRQMYAELNAGASPADLTPHSVLDRELGFDSLTRVELVARAEKQFGAALPESALARIDTPRDILRELASAGAARDERFDVVDASPQSVAVTPSRAQTMVDVLRVHASTNGDRVHIRLFHDDDDGDTISFAQLLEAAERRAAGLQALGVGHGDTVILMLPTGRSYFFEFFGVLLAGGIPVPVYPPGNVRQTEEHLLKHAAIVQNAGARVMVVMPEAAEFARIMKARTPTLQHLCSDEEVLAAADGRDFEPVTVTASDIGFIQYTSGSTGMPKGVVLTHANLLANVRAFGRANAMNADDVFVSWLPLYHDMGLIGAWFGSLYHGAHFVVMPPLAFVGKPLRWLLAIHRYRGTVSAAPNFAYEQCLRRVSDDDLAKLDLSSWRVACNGAEAVRPETIRRFTERFAACGFKPETMRPVYGLAEACVGLAFPTPGQLPVVDRIQRQRFMASGEAVSAMAGDDDVLEFVFCGRPIDGHQIRIADEAGAELPERREGRVQFKGPSATSGYFRNPEKTAALFVGDWVDTGDRGYFADGELYITGRSKDIVIKAGRNIYPEEIELGVGEIEGVIKGNIAVFGVVDEQAGTENLVVLAESRRNAEEAQARIKAEIQQVVTALAGVPADDIMLARPNTVLKTSSGKIRRDASKQVYLDGLAGRKPLPVWLQVARFRYAAAGDWLRDRRRRFGEQVFAARAWMMLGLFGLLAVLGAAVLPSGRMRWRLARSGLRAGFWCAGLPVSVDTDQELSAGQPVVYVANHASYLDALLALAAMPQPVLFVAKAELSANVLLRWLLPRLGVLFVERFDEEGMRADARRFKELAAAGHSLFFFAEGTFTRAPGLLPFRLGAFETAVAAGLDVVPVVMRGTRAALRDGTWTPRRAALRVWIGAPLSAPQVSSQTDWSRAVVLRDSARAWVLKRCGEPDLGHVVPELLVRQRQTG